MKFLRKLFFGKKLYNLEQDTYKTLGDSKNTMIIQTVLIPIINEISDYTGKDNNGLKTEYVSLEIVNYIDGFIIQGIDICKYLEEEKEIIKQSFLVAIFTVYNYSDFIADILPSKTGRYTKEFLKGQMAAQEWLDPNLLNIDLPELKALLLAKKITNLQKKGKLEEAESILNDNI